MGDLLEWSLRMAKGDRSWTDSQVGTWESESKRFFDGLARLDALLASEEELQAPLERLFQGPLADALTHVGQIAMMRRMAGASTRGENYYVAKIEAGSVGAEQAAAVREF